MSCFHMDLLTFSFRMKLEPQSEDECVCVCNMLNERITSLCALNGDSMCVGCGCGGGGVGGS